ncbi:MAG: metalloregulator ArsR/SmtB family transcription factor [Rhizobiaceae bacterium]
MNNLTRTFAALGDPTRLAIVERLLGEGELSVGELLSDATVSAPAFSRHLKVLRDAGIVEQRIDRQRRLYRARPQPVQAISAWTSTYREFWQANLDRLDKALMEEMKRR